MKGVRSRLGLSLGKKPKETKKTPTETKSPTSGTPSRSPLGTGLSSRTNLPLVSGSKKGQIPTRDISRVPLSRASSNISTEGAVSSLKSSDKNATRIPKSDYSKSGANIIQDLLRSQIDSGKINPDSEEFDDNTKTGAADVFTGEYLSGLTEEMEELNTGRDDHGGAQMIHGTVDKDGHPSDRYGINIVKSLRVIQDESDDDKDVDEISFSPGEKRVDFPTEKGANITSDPKDSESPFIEFVDEDEDLIPPDTGKDIVYLYPKSAPPSPEDLKADIDGNRKSNDYFCVGPEMLSESSVLDMDGHREGVYFNRRLKKDYDNSSTPYNKNTPVPDQEPINYFQLNSAERFDIDSKEDANSFRPRNNRIVPGSEEFPKNTDDVGTDNEGLCFNYEPKGRSRYPNSQPERTTFVRDQPSRHNNYESDKTDVNPRSLEGYESMQMYDYESGGHRQSSGNVNQGFEEFTVDQEHNPERIARIDYIEKKMAPKPNARPVRQTLQNSQNSSANGDRNKDANIRDSKSNNVKDSVTKSDPKEHDTQNGDNRNIYSTLKNEDGSNRQLSIFGRWMVTHGNLVDPQNFCPLAYATLPDQYIDISKYEMDEQGRWLDTNGRYITPFFYCFGYDGEPVYLGDCDYYDVYHNSYRSDTGYSDDFANNPERYVDLSDYQMDMEEQWMDCWGRSNELLPDWYNGDSEDEEYNEYSWIYDRPQFVEQACLPDSMDGCYPNICQEDDPYLTNDDGPFPTDDSFIDPGTCWDYTEEYGYMSNGLGSAQYLWQATGDFCTGFANSNEEYFVEEPDSGTHQHIQYSPKDKDN